MKQTPKNNLRIARRLRAEQTPWEQKLWRYLKAGRFANAKFKRQVRLGNYVVDFYCAHKKLIIELDGGHHNDAATKLRDALREEYLKKEGFVILRFWNNQVDNDLESVLEQIKREVL